MGQTSMSSFVEVNVLGMSRYQFDGNSGGKVFTHQQTDVTNPDVVGYEVIEYPCEYSLIDQCRNVPFPAKCRLEFVVARGSRGRAVMRVQGVSLIKS